MTFEDVPCTKTNSLSVLLHDGSKARVPSLLRSDYMDLQMPLTDTLGLSFQLLHSPDRLVTFSDISASCDRMFEIGAAQVKEDATVLLALMQPGDRERFDLTLASASQTLQPWHWEGRFVLPSQRTKWIQCEAQPQVLPDARVLWSGVMIDITSHRQLNAEVERLSFLMGLTERLQASTDVREIAQFALDYLVQATNCAFGDVKVVRGSDGDAKAYPLVNRISGEFVATYGQPVAVEMEAVLRQGQPKGQGLLWQVIETGKALFVEDYANHPNAVPALRHPGIGQLGIFPIPASDGEVIGVLTLESRNLQRITAIPQQDLISAACRIIGVRLEQAQAKEHLQQQTQQLEQTLDELQQAQVQLVQTEKMSSLGQLVAGVAHELNNPVSFIQCNLPYANQYIQDLLHVLKLYQRQLPQPEPDFQAVLDAIEVSFIEQDLPRLLNSMQVGASRIRDIVLSLRNFSRLDESEMKPVDIHQGLDNTLMILEHRLRSQSARPDIRVVKRYSDLPLVECYAGQLNQVFMNILVNAIDALDTVAQTKQHPAPTIEISTEIVDVNRILIRIADNGPGISSTIKEQLFNPFFTTKPVGKGTGLGLSISYQIVTKKHGGTLHCLSKPETGAEFLIEIPISQFPSSE